MVHIPHVSPMYLPYHYNAPAYNQQLRSLLRQYKIEFFMFNGKGFQDWWYQIEQFFSVDEVFHHEKVKVTSMHLDDLALQWHGAYMRSISQL